MASFDERCRVIGRHDLAVLSLCLLFFMVGETPPGASIARWRASEVKESATSQEHFADYSEKRNARQEPALMLGRTPDAATRRRREG